MVKIIKNGDTYKRIGCKGCGCIFEYCDLDTEEDLVECPECGLYQDTSDAEQPYNIEKTVENILKEEHKDTDEYIKLQEEKIKGLEELENLKIIEEQKKEIERLNNIVENQRIIFDDFDKKYEEEIKGLKRELISREQLTNILNKSYNNAKINAYEEFAGELNQRLIKPNSPFKESYVVKSDISETLCILKEKQKYQ